jgi:hypothetical protein
MFVAPKASFSKSEVAPAATAPPSGRVAKTESRWCVVGPAIKLIALDEAEAGSIRRLISLER